MLGGIAVMKLPLKTKLVTVGVAVILGFGGAGVWLWHSNEAPQKHTTAQRDVKEKKAAFALTTSRVRTSKPMSKTGQVQPAKSSQSSQEEKISDEEWAKFKQWLVELEQSDEQSANTDLSQAKQDKTASPTLSEEAKAKYQELKEVFVQMKEIDEEWHDINEKFESAQKEWESVYKFLPPRDEVSPADRRAIKMKALKYLEEEYSYLKGNKDIDERWIAAYKQIDQIVPGALVIRDAEPWPSGRPRTEYSINREYIESIIGKMPADVETVFLPHVRSMTFGMLTPEELEKYRLRLEDAKESVKK
jgi:hypothetical protein